MPENLHIVNGDAFGDKLRESGIDGEILVWRESLYEGPIGMQMSDSRPFIYEGFLYESPSMASQRIYLQSTTLHQEKHSDMLSGEVEEIILWFEHDLL